VIGVDGDADAFAQFVAEIAGLRERIHAGAVGGEHRMQWFDRACVNTLAQASDLCDELGEGVGVAIDTYHVWWDPDLKRQIARAGANILAYHVNDWLVPTTDLLLDRGMMGDGVIDLRTIRAMVENAGYRGHCEVEILSAENWWKRDPDEVLRVCIERHRTVV